jgi:acyl carrier protein
VEVGRGLIREGAQRLVALVPDGAGQAARSSLAEQSERSGARVWVEEVDLASGAGVREILTRERSAEWPVRGVVWLDAPLGAGTRARIAELAGAEAALADETLELCWLISGGADRAAEAFGAGVVQRRLARGLAATHVVVDCAGSNTDREEEDEPPVPLVAFDALRSLLDEPRELVILSDCDPESWRQRVRPGDALLADLGAAASADAASAGADARARLRALDEEARQAAIKDALSECIVRVLRLGSGGADQLDWHCSLGELGLDSLMAVELQVRLIERLGVELSLVQLFDGSTLGDVMKRLDDAAQEE